MAKPNIPNQRKANLEHKKRIEHYVALIQQAYDHMAKEAARHASLAEVNTETQFSFDDYPLTKQAIKKLQSQLFNEVSSIIMSGTSEEWKESNLVQDLVAKKLLKAYTGITKAGEEYTRYFETNPDSLKAFQERKDNGLGLSTRVWRLSDQYKSELEESITAAMEPGTSAMSLAAKVKQYLKYPDKRFRRIKEKLADGTIKWHLSKNAKAFHPGEGKSGVYRSSARNAQRLARTEINMAYRTAEQKRWQQFDFVVGYEVKTTQNGHHVEDICDTLAGKYPKTFKFMGWHPQCMCYSIPILKTEDEFWADDDVKSINEVTDVPQGFKEWIRDNEDRINAAEKRGNLPYFIRDNRDEVEYILHPELRKKSALEIASERHAARTEANVDKIRTDWSSRKVNILWDAVNNGLLPSECSSKIAEMKDDILFGDFDVFNRKYQTLNNAIIRHSKRSAGDMQKIQDRWDAKLARDEKTLRDANRVLKQAYKWSEVDYSTLEHMIADKNLTALNKETRRVMDALKDMREQERALSDLIPDVHGWHNQFGMSELKEAYRSIESTLDYWRSKGMNLSTDSDLKTLKTELDKKIKFVENPGAYKYGAIQKPYWQVLQDSYIKYLDKVDERIWWVDTKSDAYSLITKISSVNSKVGSHWKSEVDWAINNSNKSYLKTCITKLDKWDKIIELESQLKTSGVDIVALQKYIKGGNINKAWAEYNKLISAAPSTSPFASSSYVLARKSVALNFDNFTDADNFFYENAKQNYLKAPKETKKAIDRYTANSTPQTRFARALPSWCEEEYSYAERSLRDHNLMIKYISNSSFSKDVFIYRDEIPDFTVLKTGGLHIFELEKNIKSFSSKITAKYSGILSSTEIQDKINRYIQHEANQLIGKTGVENTVLSTASHSQSFFSGTTSTMSPEQLSCNHIPKVRLKIYCPQGTQAVYAHPYNRYTYKSTGSDGFWDGSKGYGSGENEIFLQSGTQFRVVKAEYWPKGKGSIYEEDRWHIEVEVIGQNPLEIKDIETILGQGRQRGKTVYVPKY